MNLTQREGHSRLFCLLSADFERCLQKFWIDRKVGKPCVKSLHIEMCGIKRPPMGPVRARRPRWRACWGYRLGVHVRLLKIRREIR